MIRMRFSLWMDKRTIIMLKRSDGENANFTRAIKSRGKIYILYFLFLTSLETVSKTAVISAKLKFSFLYSWTAECTL